MYFFDTPCNNILQTVVNEQLHSSLPSIILAGISSLQQAQKALSLGFVISKFYIFSLFLFLFFYFEVILFPS